MKLLFCHLISITNVRETNVQMKVNKWLNIKYGDHIVSEIKLIELDNFSKLFFSLYLKRVGFCLSIIFAIENEIENKYKKKHFYCMYRWGLCRV